MEFSAETMKSLIEKPFSFVERMGMKVLVLEPRRVKLSVPLRGNENHIGSMYAGALFTIAEIPGGALFLTTFDISRFYPVVKEMTIRFVKPAKTDVTIEMIMPVSEAERIKTEAEKNGKAGFVLEGEVKDANGEIVTVSRGIYQIRAIKLNLL